MIDASRHRTIFSPEAFGNTRVDVIGVGASGSKIALELAKLGVSNLHVWDHDKVEEHNLANQLYGPTDIGRPKVEAFYDLALAQTGAKVTVHQEKVDGSQALGPIVFVLTDTMSSRQEIWRRALKLRPNVKLVIETRMGVNEGRVYSVVPTLPAHFRAYEETLYDDEEAEVSACGSKITVGPTGAFLAGLAVWQLIRWWRIEQALTKGEEVEDELENEIIFSLQPSAFISRQF